MHPNDTIFEVPIIIEPDEDGFHAYCPDLPGLHMPGDTKEEAFENAKDAVKGFLMVKLKYGERIPSSFTEGKTKYAAFLAGAQKQ